MPPQFFAAVRDLPVNALSGVVETDDGYCILRRQPLDMEAVEEDAFAETVRAKAENATVEYGPDWAGLSTAAFFSGLSALRAELSTQQTR